MVRVFAGLGLVPPLVVAWMLIRPSPVLRQDLRQRLSLNPFVPLMNRL